MTKKIRYELEIPIHASPHMLFQYLATPNGLAEWFAEDVNSRGELFTFFWEGEAEIAKLCCKRTDEKVRFKWIVTNEDETFFEFQILEDEITKDVSLLIIDFAEETEIGSSKKLWTSQVSELKHIIGSV
jgi:uncharacterized protein YndB with AHSA1/START domain